MTLHSFDASTMIHAWESYPIRNQYLTLLWEEWMAGEIKRGDFVISQVALGEIKTRSLCRKWLVDHEIRTFPPVDGDILDIVASITGLLGISNIKDIKDNKKGVNENDILIIAGAKKYELTLVTEEGEQKEKPINMEKYKIPAVCSLPEVNVKYKNFAKLLNSVLPKESQ